MTRIWSRRLSAYRATFKLSVRSEKLRGYHYEKINADDLPTAGTAKCRRESECIKGKMGYRSSPARRASDRPLALGVTNASEMIDRSMSRSRRASGLSSREATKISRPLEQ